MKPDTRTRRWRAADVMFGERRGSFRAWILDQAGRDDGVGEVARLVWNDRCLGQLRTPRSLETHIVVRHVPDVPSTYRTFHESWRSTLREWVSAKGHRQ